MKQLKIALMLIFITLNGCASNVSINDSHSLTNTEGSPAFSVTKNTSDIVYVSTEIQEHIISEEAMSTVDRPIQTSFVEILPNTATLPIEIVSVFFEDVPFTYVYYDDISESSDNDSAKCNSFDVSIKDFNYYPFGDEIIQDDIMRDYNVYWKSYAVLDLDNDGINELIYYVYPGGSGFYIIFHKIEGKIYGYSKNYREMTPLYKDGTFECSGGASYWRYEQILSFEKDQIISKILAEADSEHYVIDGKAVSEQEFRDYTAKWGGSDCAVAVEWISAD